MQYHDYYKTLEVDRTASAAEVKKSYRRLSKKFHPDHNKDPKAEDKFKEINEAYQVLGDEEKRKRYDALGSGFSHGQDFRPGAGAGGGAWQNVHFDFDSAFGGRGPGRQGPVSGGGFSDFFEMLFGGQPGSSQGFPFGENPFGPQGQPKGRDGQNTEADITISLYDAYKGATRQITLQSTGRGPDGGRRTETKTYDVKIPPGTTTGKRIRLKGQGGHGMGGGKRGDVLLRVTVADHPDFQLDGHDLRTTLPIAPWEAVLGAKVTCPTLDGEVKLTIPAGSQSGKTLRLRGKGLPKTKNESGDLHVVLQIVVPDNPDDDVTALWEQLRDKTKFDPRG